MHSFSRLLLAGPALGGAVLCLAQSNVPPPLPTAKLETGFAYSRGDYGLVDDTEVFVVPVNVAYDTPAWTLRASLPWVRIKGPAAVVATGAAGSGGPVRPTSGSESGLGDSSLGLTYKMHPGADQLNTDFTARVKFPTGDDDRGIGTGQVDYYAQVDLFRSYGKVTPFGTLGYRWLGDGRYQLENGAFASGGLLYTVAPGTSVGGSYEWRQRLVAGGDDAGEASLIVFHRMNDQWNFILTAMKGFTDASANYGFGTQFSYAF